MLYESDSSCFIDASPACVSNPKDQNFSKLVPLHENSFSECSDGNVLQKFREDKFCSLHDNSILDSGNVSSNLVILAKNGLIEFEEKIGEALSELSSIY